MQANELAGYWAEHPPTHETLRAVVTAFGGAPESRVSVQPTPDDLMALAVRYGSGSGTALHG